MENNSSRIEAVGTMRRNGPRPFGTRDATSLIPSRYFPHCPNIIASMGLKLRRPKQTHRCEALKMFLPGLTRSQYWRMAKTTKQPLAATSLRTTRRNVLTIELTNSLRNHLLGERQCKSSTVNVVLKRRHGMRDDDKVNGNVSNNFCETVAKNGYYHQGW